MIAFVLDATLINLVAIIVAVGASLILSLFHIPKELKTVLAAIAGAAYIVWSIGYFVAFWSSTGQTPGSRLMQIRVVTANGRRSGRAERSSAASDWFWLRCLCSQATS